MLKKSVYLMSIRRNRAKKGDNWYGRVEDSRLVMLYGDSHSDRAAVLSCHSVVGWQK